MTDIDYLRRFGDIMDKLVTGSKAAHEIRALCDELELSRSLLRRVAEMGPCSQSHHEHLAAEARARTDA